MNTQEIFNQTRHQVLNSFPSIFTREDVIHLLCKLEESVEAVEKPAATSVITPEFKNRILQVVKEAIDESAENLESGDIVDLYSAEFSMSNNTVELDSVNINHEDMAREMKREVCYSLNNLFEEIESKEEL
jgi:VIT1/CCC1 family predicted Fe2+/Mn2+ transporter